MIFSIYEKKKMDVLNDKKLVIETHYYDPDNDNGIDYVRRTDGKMNANVRNKAIKEKKYFYNDNIIYSEINFNPLIHYDMMSYYKDDETVICPKCGYKGNAIEFNNCCPYCRTDFNFGIKNVSHSKKKKSYGNVPAFIYIAIILMFIMFSMPLLKVSIANPTLLIIAVPGIISFGFCAFKSIITTNKNDQGKLLYDDLKFIWKINKDENIFYNDLFKELSVYMFKKNNLIDYDIMDYLNINFISENEIFISCLLREVYFDNEIRNQYKVFNITLKYNGSFEPTQNYNVIMCDTCGSTINYTDKVCPYCRNEIKSNYSWIITDLNESIYDSLNNK